MQVYSWKKMYQEMKTIRQSLTRHPILKKFYDSIVIILKMAIELNIENWLLSIKRINVMRIFNVQCSMLKDQRSTN